MARSEARIFTDIWDDADFLSLSAGAQRLYLFLVSQSDLAHDGVIALRERRWSRTAAGLSTETTDAALAELSAARFVVVDENTEELLIRSFMRRDGVYRQPNLLVAARRHLKVVASRTIRSVIADELRRMLSLPDLTDKSRPTVIAMLDELSDPSADPSGNQEDIDDHSEIVPPFGTAAENGHRASIGDLVDVSAGEKASPNSSRNPSRGALGDRRYGRTERLPLPPSAASQQPPAHRANPSPIPAAARQLLLNALDDCTADEADAIAEHVRQQRKPRQLVAVLRHIAAAGELPQLLADVRKDANAAAVRAAVAAARDGPECEHGVAGGATPHPTTNEPLCPNCRVAARGAA